ncbi:MAG: hypothetical protein K9W44_04105 [Candidatus Lokiarchaeota archaeon]|nr:hypothetical protein [Candidatus Harpocratesius repetitus]
MKIFMNPEIYPDFQKLSASFKDPMLYVYPIIQHDCFGYHEIINIEMIERATLSSIDQYIEKIPSEISIPTFQNKNPLFSYPEKCEIKIYWDFDQPIQKQLYIKIIRKKK